MRRESAPRNILAGPNSTRDFSRVHLRDSACRRRHRAAHAAGTAMVCLCRPAGIERSAPVRGDAPGQPSAAPACRWSESRAAKRLPRVNDWKRYGGPTWPPAPT